MSTLIIVTGLVTLAGVVIYANFTTTAPSLDQLPRPGQAVGEPQFERELSALFERPVVGGNQITALHNGDEIFPAMLEAIRGASHTVTMETYLYRDGEICEEFAAALAERARQGVEVKVILDWYGSLPMNEALEERLRSAGVELEYFHPLSWYTIDRFNHRTHRRILVVDGRLGFTGGVGIADQWTGDAAAADQYRDTHYRVRGPVVQQLQGAFAENWQKVRGELLSGKPYFPALEPAGSSRAQVVTSAPGIGNENARTLYLQVIAGARESITIGTPYLVPDPLVFEALLDAAERGVEVRILVPGRSTDSNAARYASRRKWGELIQAGVQIFEFSPEVFYHAKLMVVDRRLTLVGSTNFDARSLRLNDEISLVVLDDRFAGEQLATIEQDFEPAQRIDLASWRNRPLREKLLEPLALLVQGQL